MPTLRRRTNQTSNDKVSKENVDTVKQEVLSPRNRSARVLQLQCDTNTTTDEDVKPNVRGTKSRKRKRDVSKDTKSTRKSIKTEPTYPTISDNEEQTEENDDSQTEEEEKVSYEKMYQENMKANADFLAQLGIVEAKQKLGEVLTKPTKPTERGLKKQVTKKPQIPEVRRRSLRIQHVGPPTPIYVPEELSAQPDEHPRLPSGPLSMETLLLDQLDVTCHTGLTSVMKNACHKARDTKPLTSELQSFVKEMSKLKLKEENVAKVVKDRIFSLAIHPTSDKVLVAAGDKWGKLGFWNVLSNDENDGVVAYVPHSRPVNCVRLPSWDPLKTYSCSYDGTLRCGDFETGVFDEVYSCPEDEDTLFRNFDFHSENVMLVSQTDGCVGVVDLRTKQKSAEHLYPCHLKYLRTVSIHPLHKQHFVTASVDTTVCLWDLRKMSKKKNTPIAEQRHGKSVDSAYFSPLTGKYILSASADNTLNIFDSSKLTSELCLKKRINHNNHVGRWLTKFRASWHPAREDVFVVGSMDRPRQIQLYSDECRELATFKSDYLGSVCSLNDIHPSRNIIAGGNSSGRVHVFM